MSLHNKNCIRFLYNNKIIYRIYARIKSCIWLKFNKIGSRKQCNICKNYFFRFKPYRGGLKNYSNFIRELNMIGSDVDNFGCPFCSASDRTRHIFLFFDKTHFWQLFEQKRVLHIAPELQLYNKLKEITLAEYIVGDINLSKYNDIRDVKKIDLTSLDFPDDYFDIIIANHVLEHIPNFHMALDEIYRCLAQAGFAIIQTPYSALLYNSLEDPNINTQELRLKYYGERDHYRIFGQDLFDILQRRGFKLDIKKHSDYISPQETAKYAVNFKEDLTLIRK